MNTPLASATAMPRCALVLISGKNNNYFYNLCGRRLAETLRELGFDVDLATLADYPVKRYDWCVLANISEVMSAIGNREAAFEKLRALKQSCAVMTSAALECVSAHWFGVVLEQTRALEIESLLDIGLHDQRAGLPADACAMYHFLPAGLTTSELRRLDEPNADERRTIPWAFVGHQTPQRVAFVDYLVQHVDPAGFVYLPHLHTPVLEHGSPHINQEQFERVLRHTRYQIWCSHHDAFYVESERFRMSLLAGSVPVKVLPDGQPIPPVPFSYLMIQGRDLGARLRSCDFHELRQRFRGDFRRITPLRLGLAGFLRTVGVLDAASERPGLRAA
jgi:hypothetical protein